MLELRGCHVVRTLRLAIRARLKLSYSVIVEGMKYATDLYINRNLLFVVQLSMLLLKRTLQRKPLVKVLFEKFCSSKYLLQFDYG